MAFARLWAGSLKRQLPLWLLRQKGGSWRGAILKVLGPIRNASAAAQPYCACPLYHISNAAYLRRHNMLLLCRHCLFSLWMVWLGRPWMLLADSCAMFWLSVTLLLYSCILLLACFRIRRDLARYLTRTVNTPCCHPCHLRRLANKHVPGSYHMALPAGIAVQPLLSVCVTGFAGVAYRPSTMPCYCLPIMAWSWVDVLFTLHRQHSPAPYKDMVPCCWRQR